MKKILILGGGFAGIYTAKNLQRQNLEGYEIELISDNNTVLISDLIALEDVEAKGFFGRLWSRFVLWIMSLFGLT